MANWTPYLGVVAALLLAAFIAAFSSSNIIKVERPGTASSSQLFVVSPVSLSPLLPSTVPVPLQQPQVVPVVASTTEAPAPALSPASPAPTSQPKPSPTSPAPAQPKPAAPAPTTASSTQTQPPSSQPAATSSEPAATQTPSPPPSSGNASLDAAAGTLRNALVNIICYVPLNSTLRSISGSGVIISPKGYILTNAHIAQYFLLAAKGASCVVRTGSPATDAYRADLAYISSAWIQANSNTVLQAEPHGTGEHDFALLAVSRSATSAPAPASFPFMPLAPYAPANYSPVVIGSYGAQFLDMVQIQSALFPTLVYGSVKDEYTFGNNTPDILDLGGSAAAQEGSSGGGVASVAGELIGTITTSTVTGDTSTRDLSAITASYIRADYASATGKPLDALLAQSTTTAVANFASQRDSLASTLLTAIGG